jgi:PIN domain nuclease of toxin-antitoxin system
VILLDTHIWVWWVSGPGRLQPRHRELLERGADRVFGISVIACWEVAKLVEYGRLKLDRTIGLWIESALAEPGMSLLHLHPQIASGIDPTAATVPSRPSRSIAGRNGPRLSVSYDD